MPWFINHYRCERCDTEWQDEHDCTCDDKCPNCNLAMTPYESEDVTDPTVESVEIFFAGLEEGLPNKALIRAAQRYKDAVASGDLVDETGRMIQEIKRRAKLFTEDNFENPQPHTYVMVESAMMIGAQIALEQANA